MDSIIGAPSFLIALPQMADPNFQRAVLLIDEHDCNGTVGYVINRLSRLSLGEIMGIETPESPKLHTWLGGPVEAETGMILKQLPPDDENPHGFEISSDQAALDEMVEQANKPKDPALGMYPQRFILGYAGWGPGQLEQEIRLGAWIQAPCDPYIMFNCPWQNIWEESLTMLGINPSILVGQAQPYLN